MLIASILSKVYNANIAHAGIGSNFPHQLHKREGGNDSFRTVGAVLIPVLVILSGIFAGLTLGYMSLDETQLNVLATSGTPKQQEYAKKIMPVRKNGHLLLVSLLLANMVVNETLPVITDAVLGGGVLAVAVSTVLIVIFAEIIPQSVCTRHGLYIGAKCAVPVRFLIYALWIVAWPVSKLLEMVLGPHHGIIYRRAELKELINLHSNISPHGGDLKHDTVAIIGHTLDLEEKVVKDAMTPIERVFMLPIDARLDYETLRRVCESGHSRVPVYEEVEVKVGTPKLAKKIVGILLVKQCVLLDPKDETPLRSLPLNKVPTVPFDEPLLGILDRFQEGRSHMAIVSLFSKGRAASVKEAAKIGLTRRFLNRVGFGDDESDITEHDVEKGLEKEAIADFDGKPGETKSKRFTAGIEGREQTMPADAVLATTDADNFLRGIDTHVDPLGIITLEDVLEELIGEEILDEFDLTGPQAASSYIPPSAKLAEEERFRRTQSTPPTSVIKPTMQFPKVTSTLNIFSRSRSQPGTPRVGPSNSDAKEKDDNIPELDMQDSEGTDACTLHATLTSETSTTIFTDGLLSMPTAQSDSKLVPAVLLSNDRGRTTSISGGTSTSASTSFAPVPLTEAILQTQNRRRAQAQSVSLGAGVGVEGATPAQAQRQVMLPKGRFKSSPLVTVPDEREKEKGSNDSTDKIPELNPDLNKPREGL